MEKSLKESKYTRLKEIIPLNSYITSSNNYKYIILYQLEKEQYSINDLCKIEDECNLELVCISGNIILFKDLDWKHY